MQTQAARQPAEFIGSRLCISLLRCSIFFLRRIRETGLLLLMFLGPTVLANAQDVEALLTQIALRNDAAKADLNNVSPTVLPKLLDYAQNKEDPFISYMAAYALRQVIDKPDVAFLAEGLNERTHLEYVVRSYEVLGPNAYSARDTISNYVLTGSDADARKRLAKVVGSFGIRSVFDLYQHNSAQFSPEVLSAARGVADRNSFELTAQSLDDQGPFSREWASTVLEEIISEAGSPRNPNADLKPPPMRRLSIAFAPLPLPTLSSTSEKEEAMKNVFQALLTRCISTAGCPYQHLAAMTLARLGNEWTLTPELWSLLLANSDKDVRSIAALSLVSSGSRYTEPVQLSGVLNEILASDSVINRRISAKALASYYPKSGTLSNALSDPDLEVRWAAAGAFTDDRDPLPALNVFVEMLSDDHQYFTGAEGLAAVGPHAIPQLKIALRSSSEIQKHALFAIELSRRNNEVIQTLVPDIVNLLDSTDTAIQESAASTLASLDARVIADQRARIERHLSVVTSSEERTDLQKVLQNIHRLELSPAEALADSVRTGSDTADQTVINLASKRSLDENTLLTIELALLSDSAHRIYWTWIEPAQKPLVKLFQRQMKSGSDTIADQVEVLFLRLDHDEAIDFLRSLLDADPGADRPLRWLERALQEEEKYTESRSKTLHSISTALVKRLNAPGSSSRSTVVLDLLEFGDFATESYVICRTNFREVWKDLEPVPALLNSNATRQALWNVLSTVKDIHVQHAATMLLVLSGETPKDVAPYLMSALADTTPFVADFAAGMLLRLDPGDPRAVRRLIEHDVRENFDCTSQIFEDFHDATTRAKAVHALETLALDSRPPVRYYAATAALQLDATTAFARGTLVAFAQGKDNDLRAGAVRALVKARVPGTESISTLISSLSGQSAADQQWAIEGLKMVGESAYQPLLRAATTTPRDGRSDEAAKALGGVFGSTHLAELEALLRNKETEQTGLTALGASGTAAMPARESIAQIVVHGGPTAAAAADVLFEVDPTDARALPLLCKAAVTDDAFDQQHALSDRGTALLPALTEAVSSQQMSLEMAAGCYGEVVHLLDIVAKEKAVQLKHIQPGGTFSRQILALSASRFIASPEESASFFEQTTGDADPSVRDTVFSVLSSLRHTALTPSPGDQVPTKDPLQGGSAARTAAKTPEAPLTLDILLAQRIRREPVGFVRADLVLLLSLLPNPSPELRGVAMTCLASDASATVRQAAAVALGSAPPEPQTTDALITAVLKDPDASVRIAAVDALSREPLDQIARAMILNRIPLEQNDAVLEKLLDLATSIDLPPGILGSIEKLFKSTSNDGLRRAAARALGGSAEGLSVLLAVAQNQSSPAEQRYSAIQALPSPTTESIISVYQQLLRSTDNYTEYLTLRRLASSGPNAVRLCDAIAHVAASSKTRERVAAIEALGKLPWLSDTGRSALMDSLHDQDEFVRDAAATAAANLGSQASPLASEVVVLLHDPSARVRSSSALALREVSPKSSAAVEPLTQLINDPEVDVRRNAIAALGSYGALADAAVPTLQSVVNDAAVGLWADCAINRIENRNVPNRYGSMEFRSAIPSLPDWPPPRPSTHDLLDDTYFTNGATLVETYNRLRSALRDRDYDVEVMKAPGGFALASRIERYDPATGSSLPEPQRWSDQPSTPKPDLTSLERFFTGEDMNFRVFLFIVTDQPFNAPTVASLERQTLENWVYARAEMFPSALANVSVKGHHCILFVYNFSGKQRAFRLDTGAMKAIDQLDRSGITRFLNTYASR